jgi:hypothetical protein
VSGTKFLRPAGIALCSELPICLTRVTLRYTCDTSSQSTSRVPAEEDALLAIALIVVLAVLAGGGIAVWTRLAATNARHLDEAAPDDDPRELFRGGVMGKHLITSGTLVRLEFFDWGIRLRGTAISRWAVPTWEARYDELAIAELVRLPASRIAVWFRLRGGDPHMIGFLSDRSSEVVRLLEHHDVPVNRAVATIRSVDELYG